MHQQCKRNIIITVTIKSGQFTSYPGLRTSGFVGTRHFTCWNCHPTNRGYCGSIPNAVYTPTTNP